MKLCIIRLLEIKNWDKLKYLPRDIAEQLHPDQNILQHFSIDLQTKLNNFIFPDKVLFITVKYYGRHYHGSALQHVG